MSDEREQAAEAGVGMEQYFFRASAADFKKIQGSPIAYWASEAQLKLFDSPKISDYGRVGVGLQTGSNDKYIRYWFEVGFLGVNFLGAKGDRSSTWYPCNKGGDYRKWYGNGLEVIVWKNNGAAVKANTPSAVIRNESCYFKPCVTWSRITSGSISFRYLGEGFIHNDASCFVVGFDDDVNRNLLAYLNSPLRKLVLESINPTLNLLPGQVNDTPYLNCQNAGVGELVDIGKADWNSYETSWDFTGLQMLHPDNRQPKIISTYQQLRIHWSESTGEMQRLEEANNCIFIDAYDLQDELTPKVPLKEITLTCNPYYRYGGEKTEAELEALLQADTMAEFLSYAVGCMFGRYSLDKPGLVLANQGDTVAEYLRQIPEPSFMPDEDNVIPLLDGEWFADDVTERFRTFLRMTFSEEHYEENLAFIEQSLGKDVRKYFVKDFYIDHVKRYKKRPIYWLFASPKGTFSALIYLHRYRQDTVSVVLQYLRDFRKKLASRLDYLQQVGISTSVNQGEKTRALKEVETLKKQLLELDDYERDTLYPLATEQVALDLDDGVKVNYLKLGPALKKIVGLDTKGDE